MEDNKFVKGIYNFFSERKKKNGLQATSLPKGTSLNGGRFVIEGVIDSGGYGIIYQANMMPQGKKIALKEFFIYQISTRKGREVVFPDYYFVERQREVFMREARILSCLNHPNVVHIVKDSLFEENGTVYYAMDLLEGDTLRKSIKTNGPFSEEQTLFYVRKVAEGLRYLHENLVIHYDLKPGNVIVSKFSGQPVIIDFGGAWKFNNPKEVVRTDASCVTVNYSPLEKYIFNGFLSFNPSADIYSLGATMVKMLTGETPPICPTILEQGGLDLSKIKNPRLAEACRFAMQPRTKDRPQSIDEFLDFIDGRKNLHHVEAGAMCSVVPCEDVESLPNKRFVVNGVAFEMVQVKGGKFFMGATQEQAGMAYSEELPAHEVTLTDYWIGQTQVTQKLWMAVMGSNPSSEKGDDLPVETVSFDDCCLFIQRLNLLTGASFRLPTEAEWEFAARGGLRSQGYQFAGSDSIDDVAWYWRNSGKEIVTGDWNLDYLKNSGISTRPVAMKAPNELGLYDMCGNVWEWCSDFYAPYTDAPVTNPKGAEKGDKRTFRGGGWNSFARYCRVSHRYECPLKAKSNSLGLRLAMG